MKMIETNQQDNKLLGLNLLKKERMIIRLKTKQNIDIESKVITGNKFGVSTQSEMTKIINELIYLSLKKNLIVSEIQVVHTHQNHKLSSGYWRVGEFSKRDKECGRYLKSLFKIPIQLVIVSKLGISMVMSF